MTLKKLVIGLVLISLLTACAQQGFQKVGTAYRQGDYTTAIKEWRLLAQQGDVNAQFNLAVMYSEGRGVQPDHVEAAKWYRKSAEQGHNKAQPEYRGYCPGSKVDSKASVGPSTEPSRGPGRGRTHNFPSPSACRISCNFCWFAGSRESSRNG